MPSPPETPSPPPGDHTAFRVLGALSVCHLLNDMVQSLLPSIYPILKSALRLDFGHIGLITLVNQLTASLLQPVVGSYTDRRPLPQSLAIGMSFTLAGLVLLARVGALRHCLGGGGADRDWVVGVSSRVLAHRAPRLGRPARPGAVAVPGGRKRGVGDRPAAGRLDRPAARATQPPVVRGGADRGHCAVVARRRLVRPSSAPGRRGRTTRPTRHTIT